MSQRKVKQGKRRENDGSEVEFFQLRGSEEFSLRRWCLDRSALESQSKKRKTAI